MNNYSIKIPAPLYERLKILAKEKGYSSAEEMINHILEKTADGDLSAKALATAEALAKPEALRAADEAKTDLSTVASAKVESIKRQLKGLGYFNG